MTQSANYAPKSIANYLPETIEGRLTKGLTARIHYNNLHTRDIKHAMKRGGNLIHYFTEKHYFSESEGDGKWLAMWYKV